MQCKIITGSRRNAQEQLQNVLDGATSIISMQTSSNNKDGIIITIIYEPTPM